jgi:regulatory protein spx
MLQNSVYGFDDILSERSNIYQDLGRAKIEKMKTSELVEFIIANPTILRRPIIVSELDLQIGYNKEDITVFLPPEYRNLECEKCLGDEVHNCSYMEALRNIK